MHLFVLIAVVSVHKLRHEFAKGLVESFNQIIGLEVVVCESSLIYMKFSGHFIYSLAFEWHLTGNCDLS